MEDKQIFDFISRFEESSLTVLEIEKDSFKLHMEKAVASCADAVSSTLQTVPELGSSLEQVKSPIVGVFYEAPAPEAEPYVKKGQRVKKGQTLCLLEAMKMMNELKSPVDGVVKNIFGVNGELVEFDQVVFEVELC